MGALVKIRYLKNTLNLINPWRFAEQWISPRIIQEVRYIESLPVRRSPGSFVKDNRVDYLPLAELKLTKNRVIYIQVNSEEDIPKLLQELGLKVRAVTITKTKQGATNANGKND